MGAAVLAFMPGTGVIHIDIAGHLKADDKIRSFSR